MPSAFRRRGVVLFCLLMPFCRVRAQEVLTSPPQTPANPAAVQEYQDNNPMQVFAPSQTAPAVPLQWGPVTMHPHVDYQFLYGNGIQSSPGQPQNTIVQTVSPGVLFNLGAHWTLDYTPTLTFYSSSSFKNSFNQSVHLGWGTTYGDWFLSGSQSYASSSSPTVQTGTQTEQEIYSTALNATYQFNDKMSLDLGLSQVFNDVGNVQSSTNLNQNLANSREWSTMDWLNYQFWSRLNAGLGLGLGYNQQDGSPDSLFEQYQGRVNWRATDKISFQLSGGLQVQHYLSGGAPDLLAPVYNGTIQYQPFEHTKLSLNASDSVTPSDYQNQTTENIATTADLNQRLFGRLYLDLSGGYDTTKYVSSVAGASTSRNDDYYTFNARLTSVLLKRVTVSVFYAYSDNTSSQSGFTTSGSGFGFTSNQVGLEIGYRY